MTEWIKAFSEFQFPWWIPLYCGISWVGQRVRLRFSMTAYWKQKTLFGQPSTCQLYTTFWWLTTTSHCHLPHSHPSFYRLRVLENLSTMILRRVRPTEQDFLLCLTNGGHIMKAIFNALHGGGRVTERRLIIFFSQNNICEGFYSLLQEASFLWSKIHHFFLCGQHCPLFTHLSQYLTFLWKVWWCHIQCCSWYR